MTLEEIDDVENLVQNLEKIELPNQLVAVLADPLLQKLLSLRPAEVSYQRIANWVYAATQDIVNGDADESFLRDVLAVLQDYVVHAKVGPNTSL